VLDLKDDGDRALAREADVLQAETPIALSVLLDRLDHVELAEQPTCAPGFFRQFDALNLAVRTRPRTEA
jgi:hypothetical protein